NVVGEQGANLLPADQRDQLLKTRPALGGAARPAEVVVDNPEAVGSPAEGASAPHQVVLEFKTLLVVDRLLRAGLADVDDRQAAEGAGPGAPAHTHGWLPLGHGRAPPRAAASRLLGGPARWLRGGGARRVRFLGQGEKWSDGLRGEFCGGQALRTGSEVGGAQRDAKPDVSPVNHEDVARAVGGMADGMNGEAAPVKRMRRVGYIDFFGARPRRG